MLRNGLEVGTVEHAGREFSALGASVQGVYVTAYEGKRGELRTWDGRVMLDCRSYTVREYRLHGHVSDRGAAVVYKLTNGRAVVGYSWGPGMLFRGELVYSHEDADRAAERVAERCIEVDDEDAAADE
jgi:hypothetical protein